MGLSRKNKRELLELFNKIRLKALLLKSLREDINKYYYIHNEGIQYLDSEYIIEEGIQYLGPEYIIEDHKIRFEYRSGDGFSAWVDRYGVDIFTKEYRDLRYKMCDIATERE
jgi:hypothetical protein